MSELFYDLHIHSCLSPCGDDEATPGDIAMLAKMLGLDVIALTDHSCVKNCPAFMEAAKAAEILAIPGTELTTAEEIHVLCLFPELENAMAFGEQVEMALPQIENRKDIFGNQLITDSDGNITGEENVSLINATSIDLYSLAGKVRKFDGIIIPAHIDRSSFSLISALGFVPDDCGFDCVEVRYKEAVENLKEKHPYLNSCRIIHDSDAHRLEDIGLPVNRLEVEERTARGVLRALSKGYN